jgi:hypothetical protein
MALFHWSSLCTVALAPKKLEQTFNIQFFLVMLHIGCAKALQ